jgi:hypothetical protein
VFLIGIIVTASATAGVVLLPSVLSPKPDFIMSGLHPMYLQASGNNKTLITIQPSKNFTGIVTLTTSSSDGVTTQFTDSQTGLPKNQILLGKTENISLNIIDRKVGNFTVTVIASSGVISHSYSFPVIVENLTMTSNPSFLTIARDFYDNAEIDLSSVNGLTGNVSLRSWVYSGNTHFLDPYSSASVTPKSIVLTPGKTTKIALTVNVGYSDTNVNLFVIVIAQTAKEQWNFSLTVNVTTVLIQF